MKLTEKQRKILYGEEELDGMKVIDVQDLDLDNHGCLCKIVVFTVPGSTELYGYMVRESSEEVFCEDEEIYILKEKQIMISHYEPINYDGWQF